MRTAIVFTLLLFPPATCRHGASPPTTPVAAAQANRQPPRTPEECKACNGDWGPHGMAQVTSCLCRTTDAGKRCRRHADCQSKCVAGEEVEREVMQAGPPASGYFVGRCAEFHIIFGCLRFVEQAEPGPLDEPPPMLCID